MATTAERMKAMRARRRADGLREVRLVVPDARTTITRRRIAEQVACLNPASEKAALDWIEAAAILMRRRDVVVVAASGDYGRPRPAVVVQTDAFPEQHASVIICQMTTDLVDAPHFRITIEPHLDNGLRERSQVMVDKPLTVRREKIGQVIGHLTTDEIVNLDTAVAFVMGLAD